MTSEQIEIEIEAEQSSIDRAYKRLDFVHKTHDAAGELRELDFLRKALARRDNLKAYRRNLISLPLLELLNSVGKRASQCDQMD